MCEKWGIASTYVKVLYRLMREVMGPPVEQFTLLFVVLNEVIDVDAWLTGVSILITHGLMILRLFKLLLILIRRNVRKIRFILKIKAKNKSVKKCKIKEVCN